MGYPAYFNNRTGSLGYRGYLTKATAKIGISRGNIRNALWNIRTEIRTDFAGSKLVGDLFAWFPCLEEEEEVASYLGGAKIVFVKAAIRFSAYIGLDKKASYLEQV